MTLGQRKLKELGQSPDINWNQDQLELLMEISYVIRSEVNYKFGIEATSTFGVELRQISFEI